MKCLICETELVRTIPEEYGNSFDGGGEIRVEFGYGSQFDFVRNSNALDLHDRGDWSRIMKLMTAEMIVGAICDECFTAKSHLFRGYDKPLSQIQQVVRID